MISIRRLLSVFFCAVILSASFLPSTAFYAHAAGSTVLMKDVKTLCNLVYSASYSPDGNSVKYDCYIIKDNLRSDFKISLNNADKVIFFKNNQLVVDPDLNLKLMTMRMADKYSIWYATTVDSVNLLTSIKKSAEFNKGIGLIGKLGGASLGVITTTVLTGGSSEFAKLAASSSAKVLKDYVLDVENILTEVKWLMFTSKVDTMNKTLAEVKGLYAKKITNYKSAQVLLEKLTLLETDAYATTRILEGALNNIPNDVKEYFTKSVMGGFMDGATGSLTTILKNSDNILQLMRDSDDFYKLCRFASDLNQLKDHVEKIEDFLALGDTFGEFSDYMNARNLKKTVNIFAVGREGNKAIVTVLGARLNTPAVISIPVKYDYIGNFSEGLAVIYKGNKQGFLNTLGKEAIPPVYDRVSPFSNGLACVYKGINFGFVDKSGKLVIPMKYSNEDPFWGNASFQFKNGKCIVSKRVSSYENLFGVIDTKGKELVPCTYNSLYLTNAGSIYYTKDYTSYINVNNTKDIRSLTALTEADKTVTGPYWKADGKNNWSLYNKTKQCIVKNKYVFDILTYSEFSVEDNYFKYSDGVAIAASGAYAVNMQKGKNRYWIVDEQGKEIKALDYDDAVTFSDGLSLVRKNNKYGYIDKTGKVIIPLTYTFAMPFRDGYAIAKDGSNYVILKNPTR